MQKILYPNLPLRCIISGPSNVGKSVSLTNLVSNIITDYEKIYIYSASLNQDLYQNLFKCLATILLLT